MQDIVLSHTNPLYRSITEQIAAAIAGGAGSFVMPWHTKGVPATLPMNAATDASYRGINVLTLWMAAATRGYGSGQWASYRQWQTLGAQVRKGESGSLIVFYKPLEATESPPEGEETRQRFVIRASHVFNTAQVDGWTPAEVPSDPAFKPNEQAEAFVLATGARVRYGFHHALYRRDLDDIEMPSPVWFTGSPTSSPLETYYATLLHELTHWSGATYRLGREFGKRFGDHAYAFEELVAELGGAFLCAGLGLTNEPRPDHAAYAAHWLDILGRDPKAIFTAASKAQEAVEYLDGLTVRADA
jgi:antirestriction protein ArdC